MHAECLARGQDGLITRHTTGRRRAVALAAAVALCAAACTSDRPARAEETDTRGHSAAAASSPSTTTTAPRATTTTVDAGVLETRLQAVVDDFTGSQTVTFSVVVVDLATGATATHLADRRVLGASLYKLFVAAELLRRIAAGQLDRDDPALDGHGRTVGQCLDSMIVVSDNACGAAGLRLVGGGTVDSRLHRDGYVATSLASPQQTSAADVALFLERARDRSLLGPGNERASGELYDLLRLQQVNDRLSKGLPAGTPLAHKTGDRLHWAHDAGVMTTPRGDVVIVVLSGPWPLPCCDADHPGAAEATAFAAIAELGRRVYDAAR